MSNAAIQEQIQTIRKATANAAKSKAAALSFLNKAGIISAASAKPTPTKRRPTQKKA